MSNAPVQPPVPGTAEALPTALARVQFRLERLPDSEVVTLPKDDLRVAFRESQAVELRRLAAELIGEEDAHKLWRAISRRANELDGGVSA